MNKKAGGSHHSVAFVLGAGFSRAISELMPLTDELGELALGRLRDRLPPRLALPDGLNFEAWLSELATEQPYLSDPDDAQNQAAFLQFSRVIADILNESVQRVLRERYPEWLLRLVSGMHHQRAAVVTFNYDPLIECLVKTPTGILGLINGVGCQWPAVDWTELSGGLPPWAPGDAQLAATEVETLRLLKLHGSLNWYWQPGDATGVSVARGTLPGWYGHPIEYTEERRRREVPGRSPFIVPPSASKSQYYSNAITREMWIQAAGRIAAADHVILIGYSVPLTDVTFAKCFAKASSTREHG